MRLRRSKKQDEIKQETDAVEYSPMVSDATSEQIDEANIVTRPKLWQKLKNHAGRLSHSTMRLVLKLYYAAQDEDTPAWAKATIYTALAYFILPLDAIPDFIIGGYTDDLATLTAALYTITKHAKPEHKERAEAKLQQWFGSSKTASQES